MAGSTQGKGVFDIYLAVERAHDFRALARHRAFDEALLANDEFARTLHIAFDSAVHTYITVGHDGTDDFATRSKGVVQGACTLLRCCHNLTQISIQPCHILWATPNTQAHKQPAKVRKKNKICNTLRKMNADLRNMLNQRHGLTGVFVGGGLEVGVCSMPFGNL